MLALVALSVLGALAGAAPVSAASFETQPRVTDTISFPERTGVRQLYQQAYDPATGLLYVADVGNARVNVVYTAHATRASTGGKYVTQDSATSPPGEQDPEPNTIVKRIHLGFIDGESISVFGLGIDPSTHKVYGTATRGDAIVIIQGNDGTSAGSAGKVIKRTPPLGGAIRDVVVDPATHRVYSSRTSGASVVEIDGTSGDVLRTFDATNGDPDVSTTVGVAANFDDGVLYAANLSSDEDGTQPGSITVIDIASGQPVQNIGGGGLRTTTVAYDGTRDRLFATNQGDGTSADPGSVSTFDVGADGKLSFVKNVETEVGALGVAVDEYNGLVYSTDFNAKDENTPGTVTVLDADTGDKLTKVTVGPRPLHTVVDPVTHTAYVTNQANATISVINASPPLRPNTSDPSTAKVSPATAAAGDTVTVSGTGFSPGQPASVKLDDQGADPLATTTAAGDGSFSLQVTIPASAKGGPRHWLRVLGTRDQPAGAPARSKAVFIKISSPTATVSGTFDQKIRVGQYNVYQSAYNPKTGLLYVADPGAQRIRVIYTSQATRASTGERYVIRARDGTQTDPQPNTVVKSIDIPADGTFDAVLGLAINTRTNQLYGSTPTEDGRFYVIDGDSDTIKKVITLGDGLAAREIRVDETHNLVYATNSDAHRIVVVDGDTNTLKRTIEIAPGNSNVNYCAGLSLNLERGLIYVACPNLSGFPGAAPTPVDGSVAVIDIASGRTLQNEPTGSMSTINVAYDKAGSRLFVTSEGPFDDDPPTVPGAVATFSIDPATGLIVSRLSDVTTKIGALGMTLDAPRGVAYSTDYGLTVADSHSVSVIDYATGAKIGSIEVGLKPLHISVDPDTGTAYVTNQKDASVSVIEPGKLVTAPVPAAPAGPPADTAGPALAAAKLEVARAQVDRSKRRLDVLAPITARASGKVRVNFAAAGQQTRFAARIDSKNRRIRFKHRIPKAQARLGTGILTINYPGDDDTQPQIVRLRAASAKAKLDAQRPTLNDGQLTAKGRISSRARGVVRLQLVYRPRAGNTRTQTFKAVINDGRYEFDEKLPEFVREGIAARQGVVHSYTLFTGYLPRRIRGEMTSYQVAPAL